LLLLTLLLTALAPWAETTLLFDPSPVLAQPTAEEILLKADEVRNPQMDYTVLVQVTSLKPGRPPKKATYEVLVKGKEKTVIKTLSPPVERGQVLLMRGTQMWAYLPDISKPLRISLRERLIGEVANGDIARVNFSGDYTPEIAGEEELAGRICHRLNLTANAEDVTYSKAVLWVEKETFHPIQAEFYGLSGRRLKGCSYEGYRDLAGRLRPARLVMSDPILQGRISIIEYDRMRVEPLPEKYFTDDYMKKWMD